MGYPTEPSKSSSVPLATTVALMLALVVFGVVGVGIYFAKNSAMQTRAMAMEQRKLVEMRRLEENKLAAMRRVELKAKQAEEQAKAAVEEQTQVTTRVVVDREGNIRIDGQTVEVADLANHLKPLSGPSGHHSLIHIQAAEGCAIQSLVPLLNAIEQVGNIKFQLEATIGTRLPAESSGTAESSGPVESSDLAE